MAAFGRATHARTVMLKIAPLLQVIEARQGIRQIILLSWNPFRLESETAFDLLSAHPYGHSEADVLP